MAYIKAIQVVAEFNREPDARAAFAFLMSQDDCYAGRCYFNANNNVWKVQTINAPGDEWEIGRELPESMSYVLCPSSLLACMVPALPAQWDKDRLARVVAYLGNQPDALNWDALRIVCDVYHGRPAAR